MKVSKYIKVDKDVLLEYIYDNNNNIGDSYKILVNVKDNTYSYVAGDASITQNTPNNQLFRIDSVTNNYGIVDTSNYTFLQYKDYSSGFPVRHDTIKIHLPINYTFGEYLGCYVKVYGFDYDSKKTYDLSNFYFDITDVDKSYLLNYTAPPFLFQEKLWGKNITINIPSLFAVANQRKNNATKLYSINYNLTNGTGMSLTSPVFIDFHFINNKKIINSVTTYNLETRVSSSVPQVPEFENLGVSIQHSTNGDYFEIVGIYNGNSVEFKSFVDNALNYGNRYYVEYNITLYEQNIRGKTIKVIQDTNFDQSVDYRPVIKFSTTTAVIDVEMNLVDMNDLSAITRRASYGMLQDEVAKYSLNLTKINIANAQKPKIYNVRTPEGLGIFERGNQLPQATTPQIQLEPVKVNFTVLADKFSVVAKSDSVSLGKNNFYGIGKLELLIQPFDNVIQLIIAQDVSDTQKSVDVGNGSRLEYVNTPKYMDLSNMGEVKFVIKNSNTYVETNLYLPSNSVDLANGVVVFKLPASKINDVRKVYDSGINVFYITSTIDSSTTVVYSGLFNIYDSRANVVNLNTTLRDIQRGIGTNQEPSIINDPDSRTGTAIVTRRVIQTNTGGTASNTPQSVATSTESSTNVSGVVYTITSTSNLVIDGYTWTSSQIKDTLSLSQTPIELTIRGNILYSKGQFLSDLGSLKTQLEKKYLTDEDKLAVYNLQQTNFKNNNK